MHAQRFEQSNAGLRSRISQRRLRSRVTLLIQLSRSIRAAAAQRANDKSTFLINQPVGRIQSFQQACRLNVAPPHLLRVEQAPQMCMLFLVATIGWRRCESTELVGPFAG